jgi:hypothetical protein
MRNNNELLGLLPRLGYGMAQTPGVRLLVLELLFWAIVILLTVALVRFRPVLLEKAEIWLCDVSRHKRLWIVAFGLAVILLRLALLPWVPVPVPLIHDEFSYLLGADTFAHGRLTNPSNPMWAHFESFHINMLPTYQSMYPPAQGLALALGQRLTGIPWTGVLLTTALMCSAIYWMLSGWLPAPWAWLGGALVCLRFGIFSYWMNSYWGGAVAALGGALVLGALPRLQKSLRVSTGLILAAGLLILANSRPLEGFVFSLPILVSAAISVMRIGRANWHRAVTAVLPAIALLVVGAGWMLYYNWRGTGNMLLMPYALNFQTYHISKPFFFQKPNPIPQYRHLSMRTVYVFHELPDLMRSKYDPGYIARRTAITYYGFFIWPFALLIAPGVYAMWSSEMRVVLLALGLLTLVLFAQIWPPFAHYAAPATGAVFLALLYSLRHFRLSWSPYAIWGSRAATIVFAVWMISPFADRLWDPYAIGGAGLDGSPMPLQIQRARIQSQLSARAGKHLVIVHYPPLDVPGTHDWIYNDADMDHARVIWARDMGDANNQELLNYYTDRQVWYVDRGDSLAQLLPYDPSAPLKLAAEHSTRGTESTPGSSTEPAPSTKAIPTAHTTPQASAALSVISR